VAKLIGTRELWQSTDRTGGGGRYAEGTGSRRRAREYLVRPDRLKDLGVGEAYVWTAGGPPPELVKVPMPPPLVERSAASAEEVYGDAGATALPGSVSGKPAAPSNGIPSGQNTDRPVRDRREGAAAPRDPLELLSRNPGSVRDRSSLSRFGGSDRRGGGRRGAKPDA
jgi:hypothetical protein